MDLKEVPTPELQRVLGILMCERMIWSRPPEKEAEIDAHISSLEAEIAARGTTVRPE